MSPAGRAGDIIGLDLGHATAREAEHWLAELPPVVGLTACTHLVHGGDRPRVIITVDSPEPLTLPQAGSPAADEAAIAHERRRSGRAVRYPGHEELTGTVSVAYLLGRTAIEEVRVLGGGPQPTALTLLETRAFVRPQWLDGHLVLITTRAAGGRIAPFEVPNPTPCCGGH
ncbi:hypothetical protein F4553_000445 [Allocatelliglobosispora scoriae]|uniref:Uncharacterized protein n=1 Tax=Allocatelliglobosispora scoriae TaxID=643052 RepID=A0A841BIP5_9ACTN|nr:hypothetical protein [Allocatelliglobosispora scoriae]MBB5867066.1 hypothetical protein [Allocatelliglobosispora scoriae]